MGKKINEFLKSLNGNQLEKLMELMDKFGWNVGEAVVFGYNEIKGV